MSNMIKKTMKKTKKNAGAKFSGPIRTKRPNNLELIPAAMGVIGSCSMPNGSNSYLIRRREFVGTASNGSVTGFAVTPLSLSVPGYDINPSCTALFPWASQLADSFERFRFNKLKFEFIPGQATSTAGRFYAAVDYDYDDAVATTKTVMMGNMTSVEAALWQPCSLGCDPKSLNRDMPYRFISCTTRGLQVENRTSFSGFLMLAFDTQVTDCLMDIYVEYELELVTPVSERNLLQEVVPTDLNAVATTNQTVATGTGYAGRLLPANTTIPSGPVSLVRSGAPGIPVFTKYYFSGAISLDFALDLRNLKGESNLTLAASLNVTGVAPNTFLGAGALDVDWAVFDSNGSYLGDITSVPAGIIRSIGPPTGSGGTVGAYVTSVLAASMASVFALYATARYVAPYLYSDSAIGAGKQCFGWSAAK